jgi:hypothetical protein
MIYLDAARSELGRDRRRGRIPAAGRPLLVNAIRAGASVNAVPGKQTGCVWSAQAMAAMSPSSK